MTFGALTAFLQVFDQVKEPFRNISGLIPQYFSMIASAERLQEIENLINEINTKDNVDVLDIYEKMDSIEFHNISFTYDEKQIFQDASVTNSRVNYVAYFENVWNNAMAEENSYTYKLNMEYHLVFLITHIAKHFYGSGSEVRMILDIAVIINKFVNLLNFSYIWQELKKLKLDVFAQNIFGLCNRLFGVVVPDTMFHIDDKTFESLSKYILDGGTFGFNNRNDAVHIMRHEYEKTHNRKLAQFNAFWGKIFLNYKDMQRLYPIVKKYPFLLLFAWIERGIKCMVKKRIRTINILKGFIKCSDEAEQSYDMMKKIGLS